MHRERGVRLHHPACATAASKDLRDDLASVRIESLDDGLETDLPCTRLAIAAGVWTPDVFRQLFPATTVDIPVTSLAGRPLVLRSPRCTAAHERDGCPAVSATDSAGFSPELFSRLGGDIHIAGLNSTDTPVPEVAMDATVDAAAVEALRTVSSRLLRAPDAEVDLEVLREGSCHRPVTLSGMSLLTKIPDASLGRSLSTRDLDGGVLVGAGHGPWGISPALGSGKVLARLIEGAPTSSRSEYGALHCSTGSRTWILNRSSRS